MHRCTVRIGTDAVNLIRDYIGIKPGDDMIGSSWTQAALLPEGSSRGDVAVSHSHALGERCLLDVQIGFV